MNYGLCACNCNRTTKICSRNDSRRGYEKGKYRTYVKGHQPKANRKSDVEFVAEDRGHGTACWIWRLAIDKDGYGAKTYKRKSVKAHRFYYEKRFGQIPEGLVLDHLCRVRACVNPDHVEAVTGVVNIRRGANAKITEDDAATIREMAKQGAYQREIAGVFGISRSHVSTIVSGGAWA